MDTEAERVAELHRRAKKDYGTPDERAARAGVARDAQAFTRIRAAEAAQAPGRRQ
ncbi:hypothetical protein [Streptomyces sioyaensis]|uniref:hypothetical protein n=1 Tax=Streptomyces sioyaensis TaxID=67364 RepID=UPI003D73C7D9